MAALVKGRGGRCGSCVVFKDRLSPPESRATSRLIRLLLFRPHTTPATLAWMHLLYRLGLGYFALMVLACLLTSTLLTLEAVRAGRWLDAVLLLSWGVVIGLGGREVWEKVRGRSCG
jgi:hypothetical protein